MTLGLFLAQKRTAVLEKWFELILETYPEDTARFLKQDKDRFTNPVGYNTYQGISKIYDGLIHGESINDLVSPLNDVVRIRSIQAFSPSQAVSFVFKLKEAIKAVNGIEADKISREWLQLESRIDELALRAFDIYTECREQICEIRIKEIKAQNEQARRLLRKMNII